MSDEHFSVDGTLIQAWASMKRFRPKGGSGSGPSPGRKGARDFHRGERRNDLIVDHELIPTTGTGKRTYQFYMVTRLQGNHRVTVGADRGYDTADFIDELRCRNAIPHVA